MNKKTSKAEQLDEQIKRLSEECKLDSYTQFVNEISVPPDLLPALLTGRPELIKIMQPRELSAEEAKALFNVVATLIATNMALREHAEQLGQFVHNWADAFKALRGVGDRIERFANFKRDVDDELEEEVA